MIFIIVECRINILCAGFRENRWNERNEIWWRWLVWSKIYKFFTLFKISKKHQIFIFSLLYFCYFRKYKKKQSATCSFFNNSCVDCFLYVHLTSHKVIFKMSWKNLCAHFLIGFWFAKQKRNVNTTLALFSHSIKSHRNVFNYFSNMVSNSNNITIVTFC